MPNDRPADHPCTAAAEKSWQAVGSCTGERGERCPKRPLRATPVGDPAARGKPRTVAKTTFLNSNLEISPCQCIGSAGAPEHTPEHTPIRAKTYLVAPKHAPQPDWDGQRHTSNQSVGTAPETRPTVACGCASMNEVPQRKNCAAAGGPRGSHPADGVAGRAWDAGGAAPA